MAARTPRAAPPGVAAPRLTPVRLENLTDVAEPDFQRGGRYDGARYSRVAAEGMDLGGADFIDCEFRGAAFNEAQLRGSSFRDCILEELYAPVLLAARSTWREVEIRNARLGSAELYESGWQSVRIDGGKLDFLNLRGAKLTDVVISGCIINELDLGSATGTRVALKDCTIGSLDLSGATLKDFDLRGSELRGISGLGSLGGVVIDDSQLGLLAPLLAAHLGLTVL